jgi:hypothetical protein
MWQLLYASAAGGELWTEHDLMFPTSVGTPMEPRSLNRHFDGIRTRAGYLHVRLPDFRHTVVSLLQMGGIASDASSDKIRERPLPATSPFRLTMISVDERAVRTSDQAIGLAVAVDDTMLHQILFHHMPNRCIGCN